MKVDSITTQPWPDSEPFVIRRGDRVKVWMGTGTYSPMTVKGLSPTRRMVRVVPEGAVRKDGFEVPVAFCLPPDPAEVPKAKPVTGARLSRQVARFNARNEPPGGWSDADKAR